MFSFLVSFILTEGKFVWNGSPLAQLIDRAGFFNAFLMDNCTFATFLSRKICLLGHMELYLVNHVSLAF